MDGTDGPDHLSLLLYITTAVEHLVPGSADMFWLFLLMARSVTCRLLQRDSCGRSPKEHETALLQAELKTG
ncbi:hypothetical protein IRJ41_025573, partial [Triplophysa rosa]